MGALPDIIVGQHLNCPVDLAFAHLRPDPSGGNPRLTVYRRAGGHVIHSRSTLSCGEAAQCRMIRANAGADMGGSLNPTLRGGSKGEVVEASRPVLKHLGQRSLGFWRSGRGGPWWLCQLLRRPPQCSVVATPGPMSPRRGTWGARPAPPGMLRAVESARVRPLSRTFVRWSGPASIR